MDSQTADPAADRTLEPASDPLQEPAPEAASPTRPEKTSRWPGWLRRAVLVLAGLLVVLLVVEWITWPDVAALQEETPKVSAFMRAYRQHTGREPHHRWVPYSAISGHLKKAVLVSEDLEFFSHDGFSTHEIKAALKDALEEGKPLRGASTLTQQLAKNLWLTPSRNPLRKVKEAILTHQLEEHLDKRRILELYLNFAEFGPGIYGAEAAAREYFGTSAAALGPRAAAQLVAGLPSPARWNPATGSRTGARRTERILVRMRDAGWLEKEL